MRCRLCTLREDWGSREAINIIMFTIYTSIALVRKSAIHSERLVSDPQLKKYSAVLTYKQTDLQLQFDR